MVGSKGQSPACALLRQFHEQVGKERAAKAARMARSTLKAQGGAESKGDRGQRCLRSRLNLFVGEAVKTISAIHKERLRDKKAMVVQVLRKVSR